MRNKTKYLVSACLCGIPCRFDGKSAKDNRIVKLMPSGRIIPFCPEVLGGLSVPRDKVEIIGGDGKDIIDGSAMAISKKGIELTSFLLRGAIASLNIASKFKVRKAIVKKNSPSCGFGRIKRKGGLVEGDGVTAALFKRAGIKVVQN
jgi:uncharacterized protein YbbK (DUF523 family)